MAAGVIRNGLQLYLRRVEAGPEQEEQNSDRGRLYRCYRTRSVSCFLSPFHDNLVMAPTLLERLGSFLGCRFWRRSLLRGTAHSSWTDAAHTPLVAFGWVESQHEVFRLTTALSQILRERICCTLSDSKRTTERMSIENGVVSLLNAIARHPGESRFARDRQLRKPFLGCDERFP